MKRHCDGCTRCCEGWLHSTIYDHPMYRGRKCFYVKKDGCSIYNNRPEMPCKQYLCAWMSDDDIIPEWMKPSESNVICTWRQIPEIDERFLEVVECDKKMSVEVLSWIIHFHITTRCNVVYYIDNGRNFLGTEKFVSYISQH